MRSWRRGIFVPFLAILLLLAVREADAAQLSLEWIDNSQGLAATTVERRQLTDSGFTPIAQALPGVTSYVDASVTPGTTYCYRVQAYNSFGGSSYSSEACATPGVSSYTVTVGKAGNGAGTVSSTPAGITCGLDCAEAYLVGTSVTLSAAAASGSRFDGWSGTCTGTNASCTLVGNAPVTTTATFSLEPYTVTVNTAGNGSGTVTSVPAGITCGSDCTHTYVGGTVVILTATPATDSNFSSWGGACAGSSPTCTITVTAPVSVSATFRKGGRR